MGLFLGIGQTIEQARNWALQNNLTFPVLADSNQEVTSLFTLAPPWVSLIDENQVVQFTDLSYEDSTNAVLDSLLQTLWNPQIGASLSEIDFGEVTLNQSSEIELFLDNTGTGILNVNSATINGEPFSLIFSPGEVYAVDDSLALTVIFSPIQQGQFFDTLYISSSGGDIALPVQGAGSASGGVKPFGNESPKNWGIISLQPNPFNNSTNLEFRIPGDSPVSLELYDIKGNRIETINLGWMDEGVHSLRLQADCWSSGIYFCLLRAGNFQQIEKLIYLK